MPLKKIGILIICLILFLCPVVSAQEHTENITIPAYARSTRMVELDNGDIISGYVRASGGAANDIKFYVSDPDNKTVLIYENTTYRTFSLTASIAGNYTLHFDNSLSMYPKDIRLEYLIKPPIFGIPQDLFYTIVEVLIIVVVIILITVIVIAWRRHKHAKQKQAIQPGH